MGTSLPELVTTIQAMRRAESDLVVGNLFGSNLFNSLAGGAVIAFAAPAGNNGTVSVAMVITMIFTSGLAWALLRRGLTLTRVEAAVLLAAYVVRSLPLGAVRWLVIVVVVYTAVALLRSAARERRLATPPPPLS